MLTVTEQANAATADLDLMTPLEIVRALNREDQKAAAAVATQLPEIAAAVDCIAEAFLHGGRLAYFGAGTSGRLGVLDASECPPTFGVSETLVSAYIAGGERAVRHAVENAEDREDLAFEDIRAFAPQKQDVVVGISASGNPLYLLSVLQQARLNGAKTIGISCNPEAKMKIWCDIFICPIVGAEAVTGSSRLKAGTAQKMILNMLSTGAMVRIGKTYHNYMIDIRILNKKLLDRGTRFVSEICGVSESKAAELLEQADKSVKTACVMYKCRVNREQAEKILADHHGILRKVIG